ncbi:UNVERIFIED_CONTAM: hypothetical protein BEN50_16640 [Euhalothece sp. KZN 001]
MSIPVDPNFIELVAADLGVAPAFIEKDWHAMRLVALVLKISDPNFTVTQPESPRFEIEG